MSKFHGFELAFRSMNLEAAAELKISSVFGTRNQYKGFAFSLDAIAHYGNPVKGTRNGFTYEIRQGVGIRIALRMTDLQSRAALTFAAVAAQAQLGKAKVRYRVEGLGIDQDTIEALLDVKVEESFNANTYLAIQASIDKLAKHLRSAELSPHKYTVPVPHVLSGEPELRARTVYYAMSKIAQRRTLAAALDSIDDELDGAGVAVIYARVVKDEMDDDGKPKPDVAKAATKWLSTGALN